MGAQFPISHKLNSENKIYVKKTHSFFQKPQVVQGALSLPLSESTPVIYTLVLN